MKKSITKKDKVFLFACLLFLTISLSYLILYEMLLENITGNNFSLLYRSIDIILARPVFYMTLAAFIGRLLLVFTGIEIQPGLRKYSLWLLIILILVIFTLIIIHFSVGLPLLLFQLLIDSPVLYILLGVLLSVSISDK